MSEWDAFPAVKAGGGSEWDAFPPAVKTEDIGEGRMSTVAALRGIPIVGAYADKGTAALNAALQPVMESGLSHAGSFSERMAENEKRIHGAVDQYEKEHPVGTTVGKMALGTAAMAPLGATGLGAKALGLVGETLPAQIAAGAASGAGIGGLDAAARGEDVGRGALAGGTFGAAGPVAGRAIGRAVQGVREAVAGKPAIPTSGELKDAATGGYDAIRNMDVRLKPDAINNLATSARQDLTNSGMRDYLAPKTFAVLDELAQPPAQGAHVSFADIHGIRRALGKAAQSIDPTEKAAASSAIEALDSYMKAIPAGDVLRGDANAASQIFNRSQANYAAAKRSELLQGKISDAELQAASANSGANVENALRQRVKDILKSPKLRQGFNADEILQMQSIVRGTAPANIIRGVGNLLGGGGGLGSVVTGGGAMLATGSPVGLVAPALGAGIKKLGNKMTMAQLEKLDEMIRSRAPESSMANAMRAAIAARRAQAIATAGRAGIGAGSALAPAFAGQTAQ